ncbi:phage tail protein I [Alkalihalophilus pseudofirmus]|uniref:phage tail protein I n=1 Tax=Alkalihalophilus pseudofirmus TaxID=79885 RepID=UPI0009534C48|nr:phage tail protein I [Alkalihalophilus pseudofirmus]
MNNKRVYEVPLLDLLPPSLKHDPDIIAASRAIDTGFLLLADEVNNLILLPRVNELSEDLLDHLAYYLHVDFYDRSLEIETKRKLVKDSLYLHQIKGTPKAVEHLIETLFDEGQVQEWFEYGGEPYTFRVITSNPTVSNERASEFIRALDSVKNMRSHLESVILEQTENMNLYFAGNVHVGSYETYRQVN